MKRSLWYICLLFFSYSSYAQVVINVRVKTRLNDNLSQEFYSDINTRNAQRKDQKPVNIVASTAIKDVISKQYDELVNIHSSLFNRSYALKNFVKGSAFNSTVGYCSYGYIQEKYPIINVFDASALYKNIIIRNRYYKKLNTESELIDNYVNRTNPIPEGERILLILSSLENVINITLENETY